jgi:hypothetical protein
MMAFQVDTAFPDAVDAIEDLIVPYELYMLAHSLLLQHEHAALVARYPRAFLRLTLLSIGHCILCRAIWDSCCSSVQMPSLAA